MRFDSQYDEQFETLVRSLLTRQIDFDFADESILAQHAKVTADCLQVNQVKYSQILLPEVDTLRSTTVGLLEKLADAGGSITCLGAVPQYIDGKVDRTGRLAKLYKRFRTADFQDLKSTLSGVTVRDRSGCDVPSVMVRVGDNEECTTVFAVNLGYVPQKELQAPAWDERTLALEAVQFEFAAPEDCRMYEYDLLSGQCRRVAVGYEHGSFKWVSDLAPLESRLYIFTRNELAAEEPETGDFVRDVKLHYRDCELTEANVLVLDHADCRVDGEELFHNRYILDIDTEVRRKIDLPPRSGNMLQPWIRKVDPQRLVDVALQYAFKCEIIPADGVELVLETPERFTALLNGKTLELSDCGFWCDNALRKVKIPASCLRIGDNELQLSTRYTEDFSGLEAVYIRGEFGVKEEDRIVDLPARVELGDTVPQDLPFYSGNCRYSFDFTLDEEGAVKVDNLEFAGTAMALTLDGGPETVLFAPPYEHIFNAVPAGRHQLEIVIYGSRRNTMGPFYCPGVPGSGWVGPSEFTIISHPEKAFIPNGLLKMPRIRS